MTGIRRVHPESADAKYCLEAFCAELDRRFEDGFDPAMSLPARPEQLVPPAGAFLVAYDGDAPIGCGAIKRIDAGVGSIKRMWVAETARGRGLGRSILRELEETARELGLRTIRLETNDSLEEAVHLYRSAGYREVAPFNDDPYARHWFEKDLTGTRELPDDHAPPDTSMNEPVV